ncbi:hypothetical protein [Streptomyces sp. NPDC001205]
MKTLTGRHVAKEDGESALRDLVVNFFAHDSAEYDIRAQLCTDIARMPIEDASVLWPEELSAHELVAVLHLPAQDAYSDARRRYADDVLSFSPWHALEAHRPLGSIMRSRRAAYPASSDFRHRVNGVAPQEPSDIKELPPELQSAYAAPQLGRRPSLVEEYTASLSTESSPLPSTTHSDAVLRMGNPSICRVCARLRSCSAPRTGPWDLPRSHLADGGGDNRRDMSGRRSGRVVGRPGGCAPRCRFRGPARQRRYG